MVDIFGHLLGIAIPLLGLAFHLQVDTFDFLRFAVHQCYAPRKIRQTNPHYCRLNQAMCLTVLWKVH